MSKKIGVYPGTFDPVTAGHLDILERALKVVDEVIIGVAVDSVKDTLFSFDERVALIREEIATLNIDLTKIKVVAFKGLLINFAHETGASIIIRGIRAISDFEYEFQMSCMNSKLDSSVQTIFLPASEKMQLVSSRLVREVVRLGGEVYEFASKNVHQKLIEKYKNY